MTKEIQSPNDELRHDDLLSVRGAHLDTATNGSPVGEATVSDPAFPVRDEVARLEALEVGAPVAM